MGTAVLLEKVTAPTLCCDGAQLQLELRDLAVLVPGSAFRLGELAANVRVDAGALTALAAYLEYLRAVPCERSERFVPSVNECLRLVAVVTPR